MATTELPLPVPRARRPTLAFGPFTFEPDNHLLRRGLEEIAAPPRVLVLLDILLERAGDLVTRQDLIDRVWKDAFVTDTSLAEAVSALRQLLGDEAQSPTYIQTVHRRGYRFVAPVDVRVPPVPVAVAPAVSPGEEVVSPSIGGVLAPWSVALLCALLAIVAVFRLISQQQPAALAGQFPVELEPPQRFDSRGGAVAISPDGSRLAWAACAAGLCRLYLRPIDRLDAVALPATDDAASPFFSPDGGWIGFFAGGKLRKVSPAGGAPVALADVAQPLGAVWTRDGRIIFGNSLVGGLWQVSDRGGVPQPLTTPSQEDGELRHSWPSILPDGRTLLFSVATTLDEDAPSRLAIATLAPGAAPLDGRTRVTTWRALLDGVGMARPLADDLIVVARGAELQVVTVDSVRQVLVGVPQTLVPVVATVAERAQFAVAPAGSLIYLLPKPGTGPAPTLGWLGRVTETSPAALPPDVAGVPALSRDGASIAWAGAGEGARTDIRVGDLLRGAVTRLTHDGVNTSPVWSADGRRVYFARRDAGLFRIASIDADGGRLSAMPAAARHAFPASVSADGRLLAFVVAGGEARRDIWIVPASGEPVPREVVHSAFDETGAALSADGSLLAYQSDEGGRWDVYVQRVADGRRTIVSTSGGDRPFWSPDDAAIIYRSGSALMRATVAAGTLAIGSPTLAGEIGAALPLGVAPDGRMLVDRRGDLTGASAVIAFQWDREARRVLGPPAAVMPR